VTARPDRAVAPQVPRHVAAYDSLASYYDAVTGDSATEITFVDGIIKNACPRAVTLLEAACGTGGIIAGLAAGYQVSGLDISPGMLAVAGQKLPAGTPLYAADMSSFRLDRTFDAIVCVYHGINHLLDFSDWESFFDCAYGHLNRGGVLLFDVITVHALEVMAQTRPAVQQFGANYLRTTVRPSGEMIFDWELEVYARQPSGQYKLLTEVIRTAAFPPGQIWKALDERFPQVITIDSDGSVVSDDNEDRTWFVCTKSLSRRAGVIRISSSA
jgi:ubiquinone/menaquinone biosynthesis C-methylase UbiE